MLTPAEEGAGSPPGGGAGTSGGEGPGNGLRARAGYDKELEPQRKPEWLVLSTHRNFKSRGEKKVLIVNV